MGIDHTRGQAQLAVDLAHPFRIAAGQIVVHRHDMHAAPGQRVQISGKGRDQGLAFAGFHFSNVALMQKDRAHQLHVKAAQAQRAPAGLAAVGKGFGQHGIQAFAALLHARLQVAGAGDQLVVGQRLELGLQRVDLCHQRPDRFHLAVVRGAEHLARQSTNTQHVFSLGRHSLRLRVALGLVRPHGLP